jgi:hypothetical protein
MPTKTVVAGTLGQCVHGAGVQHSGCGGKPGLLITYLGRQFVLRSNLLLYPKFASPAIKMMLP